MWRIQYNDINLYLRPIILSKLHIYEHVKYLDSEVASIETVKRTLTTENGYRHARHYKYIKYSHKCNVTYSV